MSQPHEADQIRCRNKACPHARTGGKILMSQLDGLVTVEQRITSREKLYVVVLGMPVTAICPSCGQSWLNPSVNLFNGIAATIERTIQAEADRVMELRGGKCG